MTTAGYWQPLLHCKNPECFFGKPTFLPYRNLPKVTEAQPAWPPETWKPFLVCGHCSRGYHYSKEDVEWGGNQNRHGLPDHHLVLCVEVQCSQKGCEHPVKLYLGFDDSRDNSGKEKHRDRMLKVGGRGALCQAGHAAAEPFRVARSVFVNAIE